MTYLPNMGDFLRNQMMQDDALTTHYVGKNSESDAHLGNTDATVEVLPMFKFVSSLLKIRQTLCLEDESFVTDGYGQILDRAPDLSGRQHYVNQLKSGHSKVSVLADLYFSKERKAKGKKNILYQLIFSLVRLRNIPLIKTTIDLVLLPFGLLDVIKRIKFIESVMVDVQHKQEVDANRSLDEQEKSQVLVGQLLQTLQKLDKTVYETATFSEMQSDKLSEVLSEMQTSIMEQIREISTLLKVELLANTSGIESVISRQLAHSHKNQTDRLQQLDMRIAEVTTLTNEHSKRISDALSDTRISIARQIKESSTAIKVELPANTLHIKNAISTQLTQNHKTQSDLLDRLDKRIAATADLVLKKSEKISNTLSDTRTNFVQQIREISTVLKVDLPANAAGIKNAISTQLTHSHKNQSDQLQQLDKRIAEVNTLAKEQYNRISDILIDTQASIAQQIEESSMAIKFDLPANASDIKNEISTQLTHSHKTQSELLHQLDKRIAEAVSLSVHQIDKSSNALADTLVSIAQPIKESLAALKVELPANTEDIKNTISIQLTHSQKKQSQILQQLDKRISEIAELSDREITAFNKVMSMTVGGLADTLAGVSTDLRVLGPQFERIELYGLTTAQRVAIHCGENAVMVRTKVGYLLCAADDYALIANLIESGDLEPGTRKLIQRVLAPGDVFVDVGANIGMHTIAAAHAMRGLGKVIAFEPFEPTAHLLEKSIFLNGFAGLVEIHRAAATNTSVSRALYLGATSGHHSLFPRGGETGSSKVVQVRSVAIDDVIPATEQITLMKIDVEGAELEVLDGAKLLLGANPNVGLIVEFGPCFLQRSGIDTADWLSKFTSFDLEGWEINDVSGELEKISIENLEKKNSSNLFFVNRKSMIFEKATSPT